MGKAQLILSLFISSILLASCVESEQVQQSTTTKSAPGQDEYLTYPPQKNMSPVFKDIFESVFRITATGFYEIYEFPASEKVDYRTFQGMSKRQLRAFKSSGQPSTSGTAILLSVNPRQALLITCNHILQYPDTVKQYYYTRSGQKSSSLKTIAIKRDQINRIFGPSAIGNFSVIARDRELDLALITINFDTSQPWRLRPLRIDPGSARNLGWGSLIYVFGFPKGQQMITRGIASKVDQSDKKNFTTDALFNEGISGGLVIGVHGPNARPEWLGMARSTSAETRLELSPANQNKAPEMFSYAYTDSIYVSQQTHINYGITQTISIDQIKDFLSGHKRAIRQTGQSVSHWID